MSKSFRTTHITSDEFAYIAQKAIIITIEEDCVSNHAFLSAGDVVLRAGDFIAIARDGECVMHSFNLGASWRTTTLSQEWLSTYVEEDIASAFFAEAEYVSAIREQAALEAEWL